MTNNQYFKKARSLVDNNETVLNDSENIFDKLLNNNSYINDLNVLNIFLKLKKEKNISATSFLYAYSLADVKGDISLSQFKNNMCEILGIDDFDISGNKMAINGFVNLNQYDYRISFSNSENISFTDIEYLLKVFNLEAKSVGLAYGLKFEPNVSDLMIIYLREKNLELAINLLENLKKTDIHFFQIVNRLGKQKPFTASIESDSFYGVSMGTSRLIPANIRGFLAIGKTYTEYMGELVDKSYVHLLNKYGDVEKITSVELYEVMSLIHKRNYGYSYSENIPLWMNKDNYEKYCDKKRINVESFNK